MTNHLSIVCSWVRVLLRVQIDSTPGVMFYFLLTLDSNVFFTTWFVKTRGSVSVVWDFTEWTWHRILYSWRGIWESGRLPQSLSVVVHPGTQSKIKVILNPRQICAFLCRWLCSQKSIIALWVLQCLSNMMSSWFSCLPNKNVKTCDSMKHLFSGCSQSKKIPFLICSENPVSAAYKSDFWFPLPFYHKTVQHTILTRSKVMIRALLII